MAKLRGRQKIENEGKGGTFKEDRYSLCNANELASHSLDVLRLELEVFGLHAKNSWQLGEGESSRATGSSEGPDLLQQSASILVVA